MSEPFVAEIKMWGGNYAPRGYAFCDGQILSISQNTALFSLVGTYYGGDGRTTFGLPNLQARVPLHAGSGGTYYLGEMGGEETVTATPTNMPPHVHPARCNDVPNSRSPTGNYWASEAAASAISPYGSVVNAQMSSGILSPAGVPNVLPHDNVQPFLAVTFIIALQGIFPSRP
jgi:microcystin-dependent protein